MILLGRRCRLFRRNICVSGDKGTTTGYGSAHDDIVVSSCGRDSLVAGVLVIFGRIGRSVAGTIQAIGDTNSAVEFEDAFVVPDVALIGQERRILIDSKALKEE